MMKIKKTISRAMVVFATILLFSVLNSSSGIHAEEILSDDVAASGMLRLTARDIGKTRNIRILPGKSVVLELPRAVRDVLIASPETVDAVIHTQTRIYLIGKKLGQTNAVFFSADGTRIMTLNIEVGGGKFYDLERVFKRIMPGTNIKIESIGNTILLTGAVKTPIEASRAGQIAKSYFAEFKETVSAGIGGKNGVSGQSSGKKTSKVDIINMLIVEAREQVMLQVKVVEMNREIIKQLGVDLNAAAEIGGTTFTLLSRTPFSALGKELFDSANVAGVGGTSSFLTPNGVAGQFGGSKVRLNSVLKAMERNGMTRMLAEPNLTAISGETARFHAGGEFPIPVSQEDNKISVEWKKFGVLLNFTPVVLSEGRISLQIKSEVSELSQEGSIEIGGLTLPGIATRNAESTVELPSGGSLMMAGLISQKTRQAVNGMPGLKNLPVLGTLFRSRDFVKQETELVILVTPYMVKPVAARKLTTPDVGYAPASDAKANLLGHFNRVYGRRARMPRGRQHGDYGFIVE